jgi:hypothetical protein
MMTVQADASPRGNILLVVVVVFFFFFFCAWLWICTCPEAAFGFMHEMPLALPWSHFVSSCFLPVISA